MRLPLFTVCVLVGLAVVECKCDRVYWFTSMNKIKLDTLQRKFESAGERTGVKIERRGRTLSVCRPGNILGREQLWGFRRTLEEMDEDSPWLHQFGIHEEGDVAATVVFPRETDKELAIRHLTATWHEVLRDMTRGRGPFASL